MSENVVTILKNANVTDIQHCWNPGSVVIPGVGDYKDFFLLKVTTPMVVEVAIPNLVLTPTLKLI